VNFLGTSMQMQVHPDLHASYFPRKHHVKQNHINRKLFVFIDCILLREGKFLWGCVSFANLTRCYFIFVMN